MVHLTADGRIYYPPSYGCQELSYFNAPDSFGLASDFIYGGLNIVNQHFASTPYYPNYRLGPVAGSVCDTLSVGVEEWQASQVSIFPNPTQNSVNVSLGRTCEEIQCNFYNMQGQMLFQRKRNFGNAFTLDIPNLSKGLYLLEILCTKEGW
ncbi:MAG: T9SS type A sorting domain-containing protein [Bacteroidetes bacterium]|nr:T9SS type A sorting domain-containing protein [Bacteroidota bacterium]